MMSFNIGQALVHPVYPHPATVLRNVLVNVHCVVIGAGEYIIDEGSEGAPCTLDLWDDYHDMLADEFIGSVAKEPSAVLVDEREDAISVDGGDDIPGALDEVTVLLFAFVR